MIGIVLVTLIGFCVGWAVCAEFYHKGVERKESDSPLT